MAEEQELVLEVEDVDLAQLLALVPLDGLSGEGRIGGRLPLVRRGDVLEIRDASLSGDAAGGWLRYAAAGGIAGLGPSQRGFLVTLSAFENLRWESLELGMNGDTQGIVEIRLHVRGRNPEYQRRAPRRIQPERRVPARGPAAQGSGLLPHPRGDREAAGGDRGRRGVSWARRAGPRKTSPIG